MEPNEPLNYQILGRLYEERGRYDEAEAAFKKAIELRPNDPAGYAALAGYYNRQGEFEKTMEAWNDRAAKEPNSPAAWQMIGHLLLGQGLPRQDAAGAQGEAIRRSSASRPSTRRWRSTRSTSRPTASRTSC